MNDLRRWQITRRLLTVVETLITRHNRLTCRQYTIHSSGEANISTYNSRYSTAGL